MRARLDPVACLLALQAESKLVFVPSMSDAGPAAILPRPPLPEPLIADARELLPNAVFASNPCRIRFYNQVRPRVLLGSTVPILPFAGWHEAMGACCISGVAYTPSRA